MGGDDAVRLKPCPWCGDRDPELTELRLGYPVVCCTAGSDCTGRGPERETEREAIAAWNTRAPLPQETDDAR